ncbi:porin [Parasedimentitalea psychrophila]|uniref:Porin n=1 Tax=Parasedimentitalea psychrophila TaxID=2997337 RepID=A0A9Y2P0E8_9RHOB|nr:porin [Parasedimentitalea psychrophila]WIY24541.1 porin [Parasedimentitalea psychrophila]
MNKRLAFNASAAALATAIASPAFAGPTYENDTGGSFTWYGQLNPSFQSYDDGANTYDRLVDNAGSNSRIGFRLKQAFGENTLLFKFETALGFRQSDGVDQGSTGDSLSWDRTNIRHVDLQFDTASYGTFSAGQGSMASDGISGSDRSGTGVVAGVATADSAGGYAFRTSAGALSGVDVSDAFTDYDGGRLGRVRYDTENYNGFVFSASYGTDILKTSNDRETYDIAVSYNNENMGDFALDAALGAAWTEETGTADKRDIVGSVAVEHTPTGLSLAVAAGERDIAGSYAYAKLGYTANWTSLGSTSFSVDYYDGSDMVSAGDSAQSWGVAAVQKIDNYNVEAYLAYREYDYDDVSTTYSDSSVIMAGARWKF